MDYVSGTKFSLVSKKREIRQINIDKIYAINISFIDGQIPQHSQIYKEFLYRGSSTYVGISLVHCEATRFSL